MEKVLLLHMTAFHNFCRVSFSARDEYVSLLLRCRLRPGARGIRAVIHTALQACFGAFPMRAPLHASRTERGGEEGLSALRATARAAAAPGSTWGTCPSRRSATSCGSISARCAPRIRIRGALAPRRAPRGSLRSRRREGGGCGTRADDSLNDVHTIVLITVGVVRRLRRRFRLGRRCGDSRDAMRWAMRTSST